MNHKNLNKFINQAIMMEETDAEKANAIGLMARVLTQATIPHSDPKKDSFKRTNGKLSLTIVCDPDIGLPYGIYPRLLLAWLITEAVKTKNPEITFGHSLSDFMAQLGMIPTGGRWGTISRLKNQMLRLFRSAIFCKFDSKELIGGMNIAIVKSYALWWDPKIPNQQNLCDSSVTLNRDFFEEIISNPIPIDLRALRALKSSAMAIDLYCWLTYRFSYLKQRTAISWPMLQNQFGSDYANDKKGTRNFKQKMIQQLHKVQAVYAGAQHAETSKEGLILKPAPTHINQVKRQKKTDANAIKTDLLPTNKPRKVTKHPQKKIYFPPV